MGNQMCGENDEYSGYCCCCCWYCIKDPHVLPKLEKDGSFRKLKSSKSIERRNSEKELLAINEKP